MAGPNSPYPPADSYRRQRRTPLVLWAEDDLHEPGDPAARTKHSANQHLPLPGQTDCRAHGKFAGAVEGIFRRRRPPGRSNTPGRVRQLSGPAGETGEFCPQQSRISLPDAAQYGSPRTPGGRLRCRPGPLPAKRAGKRLFRRPPGRGIHRRPANDLAKPGE